MRAIIVIQRLMGTRLISACERGDLNEVRKLLDEGADINCQDIREGAAYTKDTPLITAIWNGHNHIADELIRRGADIQKRNASNNSPFIIAACKGNIKVLEMLLTEGRRNGKKILNEIGNRGRNALQWAAHNGKKEAIEFLINQTKISSYDLLIHKDDDDNTAVEIAKQRGYIFTTQFMEKQATLNQKLILACERGELGEVRKLLDEGAQINCEDSRIGAKHKNETPLATAIWNVHNQIVNELIRRGADIQKRNASNNSPFILATCAGNIEALEILLATGRKIGKEQEILNERGSYNRTALQWATHNGMKEVVAFLINQPGISKDHRDADGDSALHIAGEFGHTKIYAFLELAKANRTLLNEEKKTPEEIFAEKNKEHKTEMWFKKNNTVNRLTFYRQELKKPSQDILAMATILIPDNKENLEQRRKFFSDLYRIPSIRPIFEIAKFAALGGHDLGKGNKDSRKLRIRLETEKHNVVSVAPIGKSTEYEHTEGVYRYNSNAVVIATEGYDYKEVLSTIAHEVAHFVIHEVYQNSCKPYRVNDREQAKKFIEICDDLQKHQDLIDPIFKGAFSKTYLNPDKRPDEIMVRVTELFVQKGEEGAVKYLQEHVPQLLELYNDFVKDCHNHLKHLARRYGITYESYDAESEGDFRRMSQTPKQAAVQEEKRGIEVKVSTVREKLGLFKFEDKHKDAIKTFLSPNFEIGKAYDQGDCFFDSVAQSLIGAGIQIPGDVKQDGCKKVRMMCNDYIKRFTKISAHWAKTAIEKDAKMGGQDYQTLLSTSQYTQPEMEKEKEKGFFSGLATWGRPHIEGRIICEKLGVKLHIVEFNSFEGGMIPTHQLVDETGTKSINEKEINLQDPKIIHLTIHHGHYAPLFLKRSAVLSTTHRPSEIGSAATLMGLLRDRDGLQITTRSVSSAGSRLPTVIQHEDPCAPGLGL